MDALHRNRIGGNSCADVGAHLGSGAPGQLRTREQKREPHPFHVTFLRPGAADQCFDRLGNKTVSWQSLRVGISGPALRSHGCRSRRSACVCSGSFGRPTHDGAVDVCTCTYANQKRMYLDSKEKMAEVQEAVRKTTGTTSNDVAGVRSSSIGVSVTVTA